MKVFVTGGSGFIGSSLVDRLLGRGDRALVLDNYTTGRRDNLEIQDGVEIVEGDIADGELVSALCGDFKPDLVVHAAASYKDLDDWAGDARTNVLGTANLAKAAMACGAERIIYFQTALCYGLKPQEQPITLDHPILPEGSSYSISKTAAEQYIRLSGVDYVTFRLANAYGPRNLSGPLPTFYRRLSAGQECFVMDTRRDFIYIDDLIECVMGAVAGRGHGVYHVSSGSDVAIKELYDEAARAMRVNMPNDVEVRPRSEDDAPTILLDPSRTNRDLGWRATTSLRQGVARAIEYYRTHDLDETYTHLRHGT